LASVELTAILITDLVGSTGLESRVGPARADELRVEHFGVLRNAVEACEGREVKNTGDGLMVAFGSASGALECGVRMQQLIERRNRLADEQLHLRIGIAAGEATVEGGDYFGMPSIEAARLCDQAPSDGILLSPMAKTMAGRPEGRSFESRGMLELKGIPEPMEAFAVGWEPLDAQDVVAGSVLPTVLRSVPQIAYVGRIEEHERLMASSREVRDGRRWVVMLSGEPGVGKTRLAAHTAIESHNAGFTVCWGAAAEDLGAPYGPWIQALSHYVEHAPDPVLVSHVERHGGELGRLVRDSLAKRVAGVPAPQQADSETERYLLFEAVAGLLQAACDHGPVLLVLDDLHWADSETVSLLKHVAAETADSALLVLGTYRGSDVDRGHPLADALADLHRLDGVEHRALQGLGVDEVAQLVATATGLEMDAAGLDLAREIAQETDGNPFFVAEILRHLTESGAISEGSDGRWEMRSSVAELGLPHGLREVVCRRVERQGEQFEQILTVAAVAGRTFDIELLDLLVEVGEEELLDTLDRALRVSLLVESPTRAGRFSFAHALINHALYDTVGATRRGRMHRRVAEAMEKQCSEELGERLVAGLLEETAGSAGGSAAVLAYHWREAGDSKRAVDYLLKAAELAEFGGAQAETVALFNQALELIPEGDADRLRELNLKRAVAYGRYTHAIGGDASDASRARRRQRRSEGGPSHEH
jgi:class 3 adenylate cyclase